MANNLEIKHVADLKGMSFRIPSYQRGYRWERKQIMQLLDDLQDFANSIAAAKLMDSKNQMWNKKNPNEASKRIDNELNIGYYCLQPLAVVKNNDDTYDIIDGQQRLTTIYLILHYLGIQLYSLSFESRDAGFFATNNFAKSNNEALQNIDFYFMTKAYEVIEDWFKNNPKNEIKELLSPKDYSNDKEQNDLLLHDVRFIWYETSAISAITTFNNLNYGKIGLTAAELVKAALFECDRYEYEKRPIEISNAFSRSIKWSAMEESLQNKYFWGMIHPEKGESDLHLEFILRFVAEEIDQIMQYSNKYNWNEQDSDWIYTIIDQAIAEENLENDHKEKLLDLTQRVDYIWIQIQKVFTVFRNWFEDRTLYHQIGLYILIKTKGWGVRKQTSLEIISELYNLYNNTLKSEFSEQLRNMIGDLVKASKALDQLRYGSDDMEIRKILLLYNVEVTLDNQQEEPRFPFHLAGSKELKSLEHIHPQNLDDDEIDYEGIKRWFNTRHQILNAQGVTTNSNKLALQNAINNLNINLKDEQTFKKNEQQCRQDLHEIDKEFDELAEMNSEIMHSIKNLALVDGPTNSALSNNLMDEKRTILKLRSQIPEGKEEPESYIPLGTWYAFNKYYSSNVQDLKFWTKHDREAYFDAINKIYNKYIS